MINGTLGQGIRPYVYEMDDMSRHSLKPSSSISIAFLIVRFFFFRNSIQYVFCGQILREQRVKTTSRQPKRRYVRGASEKYLDMNFERQILFKKQASVFQESLRIILHYVCILRIKYKQQSQTGINTSRLYLAHSLPLRLYHT